jgi:hypothetical protein
LYDLATDPGESMDLQDRMPQEFAAMQQDYAAYAAAHGVLPMPANYNPQTQALINSIWGYWIPTYRNTTLGVLAILVVAFLLRRTYHRTTP